jgi:hypothetical protein
MSLYQVYPNSLFLCPHFPIFPINPSRSKGLFHESSSLQYRTAPPVPVRPTLTNVAACRVDLVWTPPGDEFDQMTVTGYKILWFQPQFRSRVSNVTVGAWKKLCICICWSCCDCCLVVCTTRDCG